MLLPTLPSVAGCGNPAGSVTSVARQRKAPLWAPNGAGTQPLAVACSTSKQDGAGSVLARSTGAVRPPPSQSVCLSAASYTHSRVRALPQVSADLAKISQADQA